MSPIKSLALLTAILLVAVSLDSSIAAGPDPVDELRQALAAPVRDTQNKEELAFRRTSLAKHIRAIKTIDDMCRGMRLTEWRDQEKEAAIAAIDGPAREELGSYCERALQAALLKGTAPRRQAAAAFIGAVGTSIRGYQYHSAFMGRLAPDLEQALEDSDVQLRMAAARALGKILPEPNSAATQLGKLLASENAELRRAAADGLADLVHTPLEQAKGGRYSAVMQDRQEPVTAALAVTAPAGRGVKHTDAHVRLRCVQALRLSATLLREAVLGVADQQFPPPGRKLSKDEENEIAQYRQHVEEERDLVLPLAEALNTQAAAVSRALADDNLAVCEMAGRALESLAEARIRLLRKAASVPRTDQADDDNKLAADPLRPGLQAAVPALVKLLGHKEVRGRLAALYVLETLEADAAPAAEATAKALADDNPFVRWGACRVLAKVAPQAADKVVPALAKLLDDENGDVRATAVAALQRYGPEAKNAVQALAAAVAHKDAAMRVPAIQALVAIGPAAKDAVPALVKALTDPETEVRKAAAEALGKLGATDGASGAALQKALNDPEPEVRRAASAALLGSP